MIRISTRDGETVTFGRSAIMRMNVAIAYRPGADIESVIDAILDVPGVEGTVHTTSADLEIGDWPNG